MPLQLRKNRSPAPDPVCPLQACMKIVAGAWTANVVLFLRGGPRRFGELRADLPAVSAKVLSSCLKRMEEQGLILRTAQPTSPPSVEYALTENGRDLVPAIEMILAVAKRLKVEPRSEPCGEP